MMFSLSDILTPQLLSLNAGVQSQFPRPQQLSSPKVKKTPPKTTSQATKPKSEPSEQKQFSESEDVLLLEIVAKKQPWAAPHGSKKTLWNDITMSSRHYSNASWRMRQPTNDIAL
jgi:hypothetical protein